MEKFEKLREVLKEFSIEDVLEIEEKLDRQFLALKRLYEKLENPLLFFKLVLLNSISSYQLIFKGEVYWENFSRYFQKKQKINLPNDFIEFLSKYNPRFLKTKIKRVKKLWNFLKNIDLRYFEECGKDPKKLNKDLARVMGQNKTAKTIVFSVKMFGYAYRIVYNKKLIFPKDIFIPLDIRLQKISKDKNFWIKLSEEIGIPMLHLDSLIWITLGLSNKDIEEIEDERLKEKIIKLKQTVMDL